MVEGTRTDLMRRQKQRLDSISLTVDGVVPLDPGPDTRVPLLTGGPVVPRQRCVHAQRYRGGDRRLAQEERGHGSSVRGQTTRQPPAVTQCGGLWPAVVDLVRLLKNMQRQDFPVKLYRHTVLQLLLHVTILIDKRAESGRATRFIKVRAHRGEPLNEGADALAAAAEESDPARPLAIDQDPEGVGRMGCTGPGLREDLVQLERAAKRCDTRILRPKRWTRSTGVEASPAEPHPMPMSCAQGGKDPGPPQHSNAAVAGYNGCCQRMGHHCGTDCGGSSRPAAASRTDR
jgi:hypothetical protein